MSRIRPDIAVVIGSMRIGGAERATLNLINGLSKKGLKVDLVLLYKVGDFLEAIDPHINVIDLNKRKASQAIGVFKNYLKQNNPEKLLAVQNHIQLMVLIAMMISTWKGKLILNEQSTFSRNLTGIKGFIQQKFSKFLFARADSITAVSEGVADDLRLKLPGMKSKIQVIPNAVISDHLYQVKDRPLDHPYFNKGYLVFVSAGRFIKSKNFDLLIKAFKVYNKEHQARLIILGDGEERPHLKRLITALNMSDIVSLPGYVPDPCIYFSKADLFILSSDYEGLPGVIIEALACGCKVVSTDCESGPAEILQNGKFGILCPVGDVNYMAEAMDLAVKSEANKIALNERSNYYHVDRIVAEYLKIFNSL